MGALLGACSSDSPLSRQGAPSHLAEPRLMWSQDGQHIREAWMIVRAFPETPPHFEDFSEPGACAGALARWRTGGKCSRQAVIETAAFDGSACGG